MAVAVAPTSADGRCIAKFVERSLSTCPSPTLNRCETENGIVELFDIRGSSWSSVILANLPPGTKPLSCKNDFIQRGKAALPKYLFVVILQADQCAEERHSMNE